MIVPQRLHDLIREMVEETPEDVTYQEVIIPMMVEEWYGEIEDFQNIQTSGAEVPLIRAGADHDKMMLLFEVTGNGRGAVSRHLSPNWREQTRTQAQVYALARRIGERPHTAQQAVEAHDRLTPPEREVYLALLTDRTPWERAAELAQVVEHTT